MIDWNNIPAPFLRGNRRFAHRDPAAVYYNGTFRVFHSLVEMEDDGEVYWYCAVSESTDLIHWTPCKRLTPRDKNLNFSSPGNVVYHNGRWIMCLQTYPTPHGEVHADAGARLWTMESDDLVSWREPKLLKVKGDVPNEHTGRMIDPCLVQDKDDPGKWWCFFKQDGVSLSCSHDLENWTFCGRFDGGENVCVIQDGDEYVLVHAPANGIGMKRSNTINRWRDAGLYILGQKDWPWAQGRLTAGQILDLRDEPEIGRFLLFFHGSSRAGKAMWKSHGHASLGLAWSFDLRNWTWGRTG